MTQDTENLILEYLRAIRTDVAETRTDIRDIKLRQNDMATSIAGLRRDQASDAGVSAHLQIQIDRLHDQVGRISRRLDIAEA